jgi:hypothetical protein
MQANSVTQALKRFYKGSPLTDADLELLYEHTTELVEKLTPMGELFGLALQEARRIQVNCQDYIWQRKR